MLLDHIDIFGIASWISATCLAASAVFVLFCLRDGQYSERASLVPYFLFALLIIGLINPFGDSYRRNRRFFLSTLSRVALPFQEVTFSDFLLADILTSLAKPLSDLSLSMCRMLTFSVSAPLAAAHAGRTLGYRTLFWLCPSSGGSFSACACTGLLEKCQTLRMLPNIFPRCQ